MPKLCASIYPRYEKDCVFFYLYCVLKSKIFRFGFENIRNVVTGAQTFARFCSDKDRWSWAQTKEQRGNNKPFVVFSSSNAAEQLRVQSSLQSIILAPLRWIHFSLSAYFSCTWLLKPVFTFNVIDLLKIVRLETYLFAKFFPKIKKFDIWYKYKKFDIFDICDIKFLWKIPEAALKVLLLIKKY